MRDRIVVAVAVLVALTATGCNVSTNEEPVAVRGAFERIVQSTTTSSTTTPQADARTVQAYYVRTGDGTTELVPVDREVPAESGVQQVLDILFGGAPTERSLTNAIPDSAVLLGAGVVPGTRRLAVDTQGLFGPSGVQGTGLRNALGQIVCTATELPSVEEVVFQNEGDSVAATIEEGGSVDRAVNCTDYDELT